MKIAFCSLLLPNDLIDMSKVKGSLSGVSLHKFSSAIIKGLDENLDKPINIFNIPNVLNYPKYPQIIFTNKKWSHTDGSNDYHFGYINLFGIKYITQRISAYKTLKNYINESDENCLICVHNIHLPFLKAVTKLKKMYPTKVKTCLITGDIPGKLGLENRNKNKLKRFLIKNYVDKKALKLINEFDSYVFSTKYTAAEMGLDKKPNTFVECAYVEQNNTVFQNGTLNDQNKKIVFYAGSLRNEYGIFHLIEAFKLIKDDNYELWLAGGGPQEDVNKIIDESNKDTRIKYLGFISPIEVAERQSKSTVLISPRTTEHEYVKHSFPSKTIDCLASGIPYIAHKLPCETDDYKEVIQYPNNETNEALSSKIIEICNLTKEQRDIIGKKGRDFVLEKKNPKVMCKRITDMWRKMYE